VTLATRSRIAWAQEGVKASPLTDTLYAVIRAKTLHFLLKEHHIFALMLGCVLSRTLIMSLKDDGWAAHGLSKYVVFFEQEYSNVIV
jgi:hypothetical protein